ncbi:MAG: HAMP domain-containing methyl-accepting chemotaxis protein [Tumebacillaceae bacterium]
MKFTVRKKLLSGFLIVILLFIVTGTTAILKMNSMGSQSQSIEQTWVPCLAALGELHGDVPEAQRLLLKMSLETDGQKLDALQSDFNKVLQQIQADRKTYEPLITEPEERTLYATFSKNYDAWLTKVPEQMQSIRAHNVALTNKLTVEAMPLFDASINTITDLLAINKKGSDNATMTSMQLFTSGRLFVIVMVAITIVLGMGIALLISRVIASPVVRISAIAEQIAEGNLTGEQLHIRNRDEIGDLATSFNKMAHNLRELIRNVGFSAEQVASSAAELTASAEQTTSSTVQISSTIQQMAAGSDDQMRSVESSVQSINELSAGVEEIAASANFVSSLATRSAEVAANGVSSIQTASEQMHSINSTVGGLAQAVKGLEVRSQEISQIVEVITGIANQTNLLALNAAIEAARAGEQGRGFAVVADEVRKLAEQSANSAQQIADLIHAIEEETSQTAESMAQASQEVATGMSVVQSAGESFELIMKSIADVADQIRDVSAASEEMSTSTVGTVRAIQSISEVAEETASGTQNISAATQEQLASMEEITSSANGLSNMAEELHDLVSKFRV